MENYFEGVDLDFDPLELRHYQMIVESVNAIDESLREYPERNRLLENGRWVQTADWEDIDEAQCYLSAYPVTETIHVKGKADTKKFRTNYFLLRHSFLPGVPDERYYFTTNKKIAQRCDQEKRGIPNDYEEEEIYYMDVVLRSLKSRLTRPIPTVDMKEIALELIFDNDMVKNMIERIDRAGKNMLPVERVEAYILQTEPILDADVVRARIEQARIGQTSA